MKHTIILACATAVVLASCNSSTDTTSRTTDTTVTSTDPGVNSTTTTTSTNTSTAYSPGEGDVSYHNRKVMVYRNGNWVESDKDVTLDDGTVIRRNGYVVRNGEEVKLEDGGTVDKSGRFFDKAGNMVQDGWEGVKKGAKEVGHATEKGFNKAKEEVKDVFTNDDKKKKN